MDLNDKVISFFTQDRDREKRKGGNFGDVPEEYRTRYFHVSIAGYKWFVPTTLRTNKLSAKLLFKKLNAAEFEEILKTETVHGVSSPQFTKWAQFAPLQMSNSQTYAVSSVFRLEVIVNSNFYTAVEFSLAQLLWDRMFEAPMIPYVSTIMGRGAAADGGTIFVNVVRDRPIELPLSVHPVSISIRTSSSLWKKVVESRIIAAISVVAEKGRWSRIFATNVLRRPFGTHSASGFPSFTLDRDDLTAFNPRNPIRLELYGVRTGNQVLLGFSQFLFTELFTRDALSWYQTEYSYLYTQLKVRKSMMSGTRSEIEILLGNSDTKRSASAKCLSEDTGHYTTSTLEEYPSKMAPVPESQVLLKRFGSSSGTISEHSDIGPAKISPLHEIIRFPQDEVETYADGDTDCSDETGNSST